MTGPRASEGHAPPKHGRFENAITDREVHYRISAHDRVRHPTLRASECRARWERRQIAGAQLRRSG